MCQRFYDRNGIMGWSRIEKFTISRTKGTSDIHIYLFRIIRSLITINIRFNFSQGMSEEVFGTLATMLPSIFRVSNPLVFKATSTPQTPKK